MVEDIAVQNFRDYLRINTAHPHPDYVSCTKFLRRLADELNYETTVYECVPGKPMVVMTLRGTDPSLPSLMLYSHTDVVPADKEFWKFDPFAAVKDTDGKIYGRGTQDTKSIGIQYIEALKRLHQKGIQRFLRTVHIVWGPDEEKGGNDGMGKFCETNNFRCLNVGFVLDEGLASEEDCYKVFYGDRCPWWIIVTCRGKPGHGSQLFKNTAGEKLQKVITNFMNFRAEQLNRLEADPSLNVCDVISVNLTKVEGGTQTNILPPEMKAWFDIRLPPNVDFEDFEMKIERWCMEAGTDVAYEYIVNTRIKETTPITDDDPWWRAFSSVFKEMNHKISAEIFLGATDSRFLRQKGYRSIGFSPIKKTPVLLHDHNEYITEQGFLQGVAIYENLIERLANLSTNC